MIEFEEYKSKLNDLKPKLEELRAAFVPQSLLDELERLHAMAEAPGFWDDPARSQKAVMRTKTLERKRDKFQSMCSEWDDLMTICEMAEEEDDDSMLEELKTGFAALTEDMETCRLETLLTGHYDKNNAMMSFQAGAGGTEAQDWASMLMRMYLRWAEARGFKTEIIEESEGEVAGIKSVTIKIIGDYAYGWLRTETGVHRLVRKSPFDSGGRRHTSFSSAFVYPEVEDDIDIEINPADLRIDVYRASGAGGQHVNRTESAVRITHIPTGLVTQCQNDRSQHKNKDQAMKQMKAKLYELEMQKKNAEKQAMEDNKSDIGWGSQIRSYVLDDSRIKDLRTGVETRNTQAVLDGSLDQFIEASLKAGL